MASVRKIEGKSERFSPTSSPTMTGPIEFPPSKPMPHTIEFDNDRESAGTKSATAERNTG
jgi:hypothetical protein